jgi:putative transposase
MDPRRIRAVENALGQQNRGQPTNWIIEPRRGVLDSAGTDALRTMFTTICGDFGADLRARDGEDDHVHLLVEYPPGVAIPKLVNSLTNQSII